MPLSEENPKVFTWSLRNIPLSLNIRPHHFSVVCTHSLPLSFIQSHLLWLLQFSHHPSNLLNCLSLHSFLLRPALILLKVWNPDIPSSYFLSVSLILLSYPFLTYHVVYLSLCLLSTSPYQNMGFMKPRSSSPSPHWFPGAFKHLKPRLGKCLRST